MSLASHAAGALCLGLASGVAVAQSVLHVYGPGGPAPAMKEAAAAFEKTKRGSADPASQQFVDFLKSSEGAAIFSRWGWMTAAPHDDLKAPA